MRSLRAAFPLPCSLLKQTPQGYSQLNEKALNFPPCLPVHSAWTWSEHADTLTAFACVLQCQASICPQSGWGWRTKYAGSQGETLDLETHRQGSRDTGRQGRLCNKDKILWQSAHYIKVERAKLIPSVRMRKPMALYSGQIWFQKLFLLLFF